MDLLTYFSNMCRQLGVHLKTESPSIKTLVPNKKSKNKNGVVARYNFGEFYLDIYYIENMRGGFSRLSGFHFSLTESHP